MMQNIKNFQRYTPENTEEQAISEAINAIFLRSEDGQDWYQCQKDFSKDTVKILYSSDGVLRSMTTDVSGFFPEGCSVAEVDAVPELANIDGGWQFTGEAVVPRVYREEERAEQAARKKHQLLKEAAQFLAPFQDAVELELATEKEKEDFRAWKKYRVQVNRIDTTAGDEIHWPDLPET